MFKKKLSFIIFIVGILVFIVGIIFSFLQEPNQNKENTNSEEDKQIVDEPEVSGLSFRKFEVKKNKDNGVTLSYMLINKKGIIISNSTMKIKFFNQNELLDTYDYDIEVFEEDDDISVETELMLEYEKITRYELEFRDTTMEIVPNLGKNYLLIPSSNK